MHSFQDDSPRDLNLRRLPNFQGLVCETGHTVFFLLSRVGLLALHFHAILFAATIAVSVHVSYCHSSIFPCDKVIIWGLAGRCVMSNRAQTCWVYTLIRVFKLQGGIIAFQSYSSKLIVPLKTFKDHTNLYIPFILERCTLGSSAFFSSEPKHWLQTFQDAVCCQHVKVLKDLASSSGWWWNHWTDVIKDVQLLKLLKYWNFSNI